MKSMKYELFMIFLALGATISALMQLNLTLGSEVSRILIGLDAFIWVVFVLDYSVRFLKSESKREFVLTHKLELLTIIPFDSVFRAFRLVRWVKLLKLLKLVYLFEVIYARKHKHIFFVHKNVIKIHFFIHKNVEAIKNVLYNTQNGYKL